MSKKTSEQDVGSEDFDKLLGFFNNENEAPPPSELDTAEMVALKILLVTPAHNRRAMRLYLRQKIALIQKEKGDKVKKAA